jgi:hypothetical protein
VLLDEAAIVWLDARQARVCKELTPLVDADSARWLAAPTRPIRPGLVSES